MINVKPFIVRVVVIAGLLCLASVVRLEATTADDLCAPAADPCRVTTRVTVTDQSIIDVGARELRIENGGSLEAALGVTAAGDMTVRAGRVTVLTGGSLLAVGNASRNGGDINVVAEEITIDGRVSATGGSGGIVSITGSGRVTVGGTIEASRFANEGEGGEIVVQGGILTVTGTLAAVGGLSGFGGDITLQATGDVTLSGLIDAQGGDGGTVEVLSGINNGAGTITVSAAAVLDVDARSPGGFGGSIDLDARGDGIATGHVTMDGTLTSEGGTGTDETTGGDGGGISVTAEGNVTTDDDGALMDVQGGRPDGFGGEVEVLTNRGHYLMAGLIVIGPQGLTGSGGDLTIDVGGDLTIDGRLEGSGGSALLIEADGSLLVEPGGSIDVSEGGELDLAAGTGLPDQLGRMVVRGPLTANGGTITIAARDAVTLSAPVRADGVRDGGPGGSVEITVGGGQALLNNLISVHATGGNQTGGIVSIDAEGRVSVVGNIDATGVGTAGGMVGLISITDTVDISGTIDAGATGTGAGGSVEVVSAIELFVSGTIRANGGSPNGVGGGTIELNSCSINVRESGLLSSMRPNGINRIIGRRETLFLGTMRADNQTGLNEFRYRTAQNQPLIFGTVQPTEKLVVDGMLAGCVECGNGNTEPPEECDDGNQDDGDGCSRSCMDEEILLGDANGDLEVDEADLDAVIAEIFDGDGDSVADVGSPEGSFSGRPGADANENERIESADLGAIIGLLVE